MKRTEAVILSEIMNDARNLTLYYIDKLKGKDLHQTFTLNDTELNSALWVIGHLSVTENYLLLRCTGGEIEKFEWAPLFGMGASIPPKENYPSTETILDTFNFIHKKAITHISSLTEEQLQEPIHGNMKFPGIVSVRDVISHAIRHEASHAGHLGWLCKLHGIKTI